MYCSSHILHLGKCCDSTHRNAWHAEKCKELRADSEQRCNAAEERTRPVCS